MVWAPFIIFFHFYFLIFFFGVVYDIQLIDWIDTNATWDQIFDYFVNLILLFNSLRLPEV